MKKIISILMTICILLTFSVPLNTNAATKYSYNQSKALDYAAKHWNDGVGLCAEFVWRCVQAGGIDIEKKTGTRSCFNGIVNNSYATKHQLKLNSKGYATKADNSSILSPGDVVVQYCTSCDLFPHIILFSKYDSNGNALYYAHNGAMNNSKYQLNQNSQHTKKACKIIAYVAHFPQNNTTTDATALTPASISLSESALNLNLSTNPSETIDITLSGTLPSWYQLYFECDSPVDFSWGTWSGDSRKNSIKITATENTKSGAIGKISIKDSSGKEICVSTPFTINVSKPQESPKVILSKSTLNLDLSSNPSDSIEISLTGELPSNYFLKYSCSSNINVSWGNWYDNGAKNSITVTATNDTVNGSVGTIYLIDENEKIYAQQTFTLNVSKAETSDISLSKSTLNLDFSSKPSDMLTITSVGNSDEAFNLSVSLPPEFDFQWSNATSNSVDLTVYATQNVDRAGEGIIYMKDANGNLLKTKTFRINLVASGIEIIYDANGGKNAPDTEIVKTGSTLYITYEEPTRTGYTFKGWSRSRTDKYPQYTAGDAIHISDSGLTLYAVWSANLSYEEAFADRNRNEISVYVNGNKIEFDVPPMLINDRTMVPLRAIFEALGVNVEWDGATQTAIGKTKYDTVKITIGKDYLIKNNYTEYLDSPAVLISGRTLVPARAIAESFDCEVKWHGDIQVVEIVN